MPMCASSSHASYGARGVQRSRGITLDFTARNRMRRKGVATWKAAHKTIVYGLALWWTAHLTPSVPLSTSPLAPATHWEQLYFPALEPMTVERGEQLSANLRSHSSEEGGTDLAWTLAIAQCERQAAQRSVAQPREGIFALIFMLPAQHNVCRRDRPRFVVPSRFQKEQVPAQPRCIALSCAN